MGIFLRRYAWAKEFSLMVRFGPLRATGNRRIHHQVRDEDKCLGGVDTSVSDLPRRTCSRFSGYHFPRAIFNVRIFRRLWKLLPLRKTVYVERFPDPDRCATSLCCTGTGIALLSERVSVGHELPAAFLVDYTYPEPFAELFETLAPPGVARDRKHQMAI